MSEPALAADTPLHSGWKGEGEGEGGEKGQHGKMVGGIMVVLTLHTGTSSTLKVCLYWNVLLWISCDTNS